MKDVARTGVDPNVQSKRVRLAYDPFDLAEARLQWWIRQTETRESRISAAARTHRRHLTSNKRVRTAARSRKVVTSLRESVPEGRRVPGSVAASQLAERAREDDVEGHFATPPSSRNGVSSAAGVGEAGGAVTRITTIPSHAAKNSQGMK
jgi:hypothetical protein